MKPVSLFPRLKFFAIALANASVVLTLTACGGAGGSSSSAGPPPPPLPPPTPVVQPAKFAYVYNISANPVQGLGASITGFDVNGSTGALTSMAGSPFAAETGFGLAATPDGKFLYAGTDINLQTATSSVVRYAIGADGTLTKIDSTAAPVLHILSDFHLHPSGHFLYFVADTSAGTGTFGFQTGSDGSLTPIPGVPVVQPGWAIMDLAVSGNFLYATAVKGTGATGGGVWAYTIDQNSGALAPVAGAPFTFSVGPPLQGGTGNAPNTVFAAADTQGRFLFLMDNIDSKILVMAINSTTGALSEVGSPVPTPNFAPGHAALDPAGKIIFVASTFGGNLIQAFSIGANGTLTEVPGVPFNNGPITYTLKVDPTGTFLYVVNIDPGKVMVYSIAANGAITPISGSPFRTPEMNGTNPAFIALVQ